MVIILEEFLEHFLRELVILLIYTYRIQGEDHKINNQNQDIDYINNLYDSILEDINNTEFGEHKGLEAFYNYRWEPNVPVNSVLDSLNAILYSFENLILFAKATKYKNEEIKRITLTRIYFLFYSKVLWPVSFAIWDQKDKLLSKHDDSKFILPMYAKLTKETVNYLGSQKVIAVPKQHIQTIMDYPLI